MKQKTRFSVIAAGALAMGLLLGASLVQAADVIADNNNNVTRINNLDVSTLCCGVVTYDVVFRFGTGYNVYGQNLDDLPFIPPAPERDALAAVIAINNALDDHIPVPVSAGDASKNIYYIGVEVETGPGSTGLLGVVGGDNLTGSFWETCGRASDCITGVTALQADQQFTYADLTPPGSEQPPPPDLVDLSGDVETSGGTPLCSLVLASGQFMFTCNPNGPFSLLDLPRENDSSVKRQVYVDGFFPNVEVLQGTTGETVVMQRAGTCPSYNTPYQPGFFPGSAGKRINVSGKVLLQNTQTPVCAMVLANGQFAFTCDGTGSYAGNIPLDANGQFKLQVYAQGFAPTIQVFDEFQAINDVGMARAAECQ